MTMKNLRTEMKLTQRELAALTGVSTSIISLYEGTTDGLHPNDIGFDRFIKQVKPRIINVIK